LRGKICAADAWPLETSVWLVEAALLV